MEAETTYLGLYSTIPSLPFPVVRPTSLSVRASWLPLAHRVVGAINLVKPANLSLEPTGVDGIWGLAFKALSGWPASSHPFPALLIFT